MEPFEKLAFKAFFEKKLITDTNTNKLKRIEVWKFFTKCRVEIFAVPIRFSLYDGWGYNLSKC
jgi:hypothetical protein